MDCFQDAAIGILTFQGYLNYQNKPILQFLNNLVYLIFNSKFEEFVYNTIQNLSQTGLQKFPSFKLSFTDVATLKSYIISFISYFTFFTINMNNLLNLSNVIFWLVVLKESLPFMKVLFYRYLTVIIQYKNQNAFFLNRRKYKFNTCAWGIHIDMVNP